nr:immunoglobulin heavy chain junction region [Mus musculus]
CTTNDGFLW